MNIQQINRVLKLLALKKVLFTFSYLLFVLAPIVVTNNGFAEEDLWQINNTLQTHFLGYSGTPTRDNAFSAGYFMKGDYLDTGTVGFGYNYTLVNLDNNADITENLFYLSGQYHMFLDSLPGKLSLHFDAYFAEDTLKYNDASPPTTTTGPGGMDRKNAPGGSSIVEEGTSLTVYNPILTFINYGKTFYADLGYAFSEYDGDSITKVYQLTPSVGFGWNESYDWLRLRAYLINLDQNNSVYSDDKFESFEVKYTHWFADDAASQLDFIRFSVLLGERVLAVDPDTAVVYSITDTEKGSANGSVQWKLSESTKVMALIQYAKYHNEPLADNYDSLLFYINLQFQNK